MKLTQNNNKCVHIGLVAGEKSGDILGAGLIKALASKIPDVKFSGLGGSQMQAAGLDSIADMERLSVMGLIEPLKRLPDLIALRQQLIKHFTPCHNAMSGDSVDLLITIDSPDFNLGLARKVRKQDIPVCHYVCPSVWAWRQGRVKKIRASVDHVLALLPFERQFLQQHDVPATFVGHPLAEQLSPVPPVQHSNSTICVMPGSRHSEVVQLAPLFLETIKRCLANVDELRVSIPSATARLDRYLRQQVVHAGLSLNRVHVEPCFEAGESIAAMRKADVVLMASGTATLEAALLGKPMVVAYRMSPLGHTIAKKLVKVEHISLPNLLLNKAVVPEWIQDDATPENLSASILALLQDASRRSETYKELSGLHALLNQNANERAADAVIQLLKSRGLIEQVVD